MRQHSLTWFRTLRVWWSIVLQSFLNTFFFGIVVGVPGYLVVKVLGWASLGVAEAVAGVITPIVYFLSMLWGVRLAIEKEYRDFRFDVVELYDPRLR